MKSIDPPLARAVDDDVEVATSSCHKNDFVSAIYYKK
jgi:hypothetical protein